MSDLNRLGTIISTTYRNILSRSIVSTIRLRISNDFQYIGKVILMAFLLWIGIIFLTACAKKPTLTPTLPLKITLNANPSEIYPGGSTLLSISLEDNSSKDAYTFSWSATHEGLTPTDGEAIFTAPSDLPGGTKVGITGVITESCGLA